MSANHFQHRLRRYRDQHKISKRDLGIALGVTDRYVSMIENGQKNVACSSAIAKLFALLETNQVSFDRLIAGDLPFPSVSSRKTPVTNRLAIMMERIRQDVEMMADSSEAQRRELAVSAKNHIDQLVAWMNAKD